MEASGPLLTYFIGEALFEEGAPQNQREIAQNTFIMQNL